MVTITIEQIEEEPHTFVEQLKVGEDILITSGSAPLARVHGLKGLTRQSLFGSLAGKMWISEDFDAPLEEFDAV